MSLALFVTCLVDLMHPAIRLPTGAGVQVENLQKALEKAKLLFVGKRARGIAGQNNPRTS